MRLMMQTRFQNYFTSIPQVMFFASPNAMCIVRLKVYFRLHDDCAKFT